MTTANAIQRSWQNARDEWAASLRLRIGIWLVLAIVWFYGLLLLNNAITASKAAWQSAETKLMRVQSVSNSGDWPSRALEMRAALAEFEGLLWRESSVGVAQAAIQEHLARSLANAGLNSRQVRVSVAEPLPSPDTADLLVLRAQVSVDFRAEAFNNWLGGLARDIAQRKPALVVESVSIRSAPAPLAELELAAYLVNPALKPGTAPSRAQAPAGKAAE